MSLSTLHLDVIHKCNWPPEADHAAQQAAEILLLTGSMPFRVERDSLIARALRRTGERVGA